MKKLFLWFIVIFKNEICSFHHQAESSALDTERMAELGRVREGGQNDQKWSKGQTRGQRRDLINAKQTISILVTIFLSEGKYFVPF